MLLFLIYIQIYSVYRTCLSLLHRISGHNLDIKRERHSNTPSNNRICLSCNIGAVEDEIHFLNTCSAYQHKL
jgi:hypothetical protein